VKPYLFNRRFVCTAGHQYFVDGEIKFDSIDLNVDFTYRTLFGPIFSAAWDTWRDCNYNRSLAARRLLGCIEPTIPGEDALIRNNQALFIETHKEIIYKLRSDFAEYFADYTNPRDEVALHVHDPHIKRELREHTYDEMHEDGKIEDSTGHWTRKTVKAKLKKAEKAKFVRDPKDGKLPRMIFDVGCSASLLGSELMARAKKAFDEVPLQLDNAHIRFVKSPNPFSLEEAFKELFACEDDLTFVCFSDDSAFAIRIGGRVFYCEGDISSADASYTPALFEAEEGIYPDHCKSVAQRLTDQCRLPMKIADCNDPKKYVILKPLMPVLYSGSTKTTFINTLANYFIAVAIAEALQRGDIHADTLSADITRVVRAAGYVYKVKVHEDFEQMQFLKHSPVLDTDGSWRPLLNPGVLLRASGMTFGDLPGSGDLSVRAAAFQRGLLQGAYPYATFRLLQSMWKAVGQGEAHLEAKREFEYKVVGDDKYPKYVVDEESLMRRYKITAHEMDVMCELAEHGVGYSIRSSGFEKMLIADYDLIAQDYKHPNFFFSHGKME